MTSLKLKTDFKQISGEIFLPASKSISNRALIIQQLSGNAFDIFNLSSSGDTRLLLELLHDQNNVLNTGNSGTVIRFLTAYLAFCGEEKILDGSRRMRQRPIGGLVSALNELGAKIEYQEQAGFPPIKINRAKLSGRKIQLDASESSQFISALLMIAPKLEGGLRIELLNKPVSASYIDMTIQMLNYWGIRVDFSHNFIDIKQQDFNPANIFIEPDWSSASYIFSIATLFDDIDIKLPGLQEFSIQGDAIVAKVMEQFGIFTTFKNNTACLKRIGFLKPDYFNYDFSSNPDLMPGFAVLCLCLKIPFRFNGISTLINKESDRIFSLQNEFRKFNIMLEGDRNSLSCNDFSNFEIKEETGIDSYDDHRIFMSFAALACKHQNVFLKDAEVTAKSYPKFIDDLEKLGIGIGYL